MILAAVMSLGAASVSRASVIVTYAENAGRETTSLTSTQTYDFNNLSTGLNTNVSWSGVGTFNRLYIKNPDTYGGATDSTHPGGTKYSVQGVGTSVSSTTLTLAHDSAYFGLWWSAGDPSNVLDFYDHGRLQAEFTTRSLLSSLSAAYKGNPRNRSLDSNEPFAFINFYGDAQTNWDQIVFRNATSSGFESDNYTSRITTYDPHTDGSVLPGVTVARVSGTTTTVLRAHTAGAALWGSASAVPGAPAPPMALLLAFGFVFLVKRKQPDAKASH